MSITLLEIRNPKWKTIKNWKVDDNNEFVLDSEGNQIEEVALDSEGNPLRCVDCETKWSHLGDSSQDWIPFSATPWDKAEHGKALYEALINGDHGAIADE
tara:strand:+ start:546 stop:845 length:300 start_codon:yes stop_codon:yes gene_type:complete